MAIADGITIHADLCRFLIEELLDPSVSFDEQAELAALGVDSFALMEVLLFVERRYQVQVPVDLLTPENTRTALSLSACVAAALGVSQVA